MPGNSSISNSASQVVGESGQTKQWQVQISRDQLKPAVHLAWQIQDNQRHKHNQTQSNIVRPFQILNQQPRAIGDQRQTQERSKPLTDTRQPATEDDGRKELLGIGGNPLEKLEFLQHATRALGYGAKRVVRNMHRQSGLLCDQPVDTA